MHACKFFSLILAPLKKDAKTDRQQSLNSKQSHQWKFGAMSTEVQKVQEKILLQKEKWPKNLDCSYYSL